LFRLKPANGDEVQIVVERKRRLSYRLCEAEIRVRLVAAEAQLARAAIEPPRLAARHDETKICVTLRRQVRRSRVRAEGERKRYQPSGRA